jgi:hypothetical protein
MEDIDVSPSGGFSQIYNTVNEKVYNTSNPLILVILVCILLIYFTFFSYLGESTTIVETPGITFIEILFWGLFIFLILINGVQYIYKINVKTALKNLFTGVPEVDIKIKDDNLFKKMKPLKPILPIKQDEVYHISDNVYNYDDAKAICKAYDSELATYSQVENAYKNGGEWCGYGWSKDQMALYPTQKKTWNKLQDVEGHEHDCGRPGINGGYIKNPNVRFGVNCYGKKPDATQEEKELMNGSNEYPLSESDINQRKLVKYYKTKLDEILISPFNKKRWSRI